MQLQDNLFYYFIGLLYYLPIYPIMYNGGAKRPKSPFSKGGFRGNVNMASRHYIKDNKKALPSGKALHINLGNLIIYPYNPLHNKYIH